MRERPRSALGRGPALLVYLTLTFGIAWGGVLAAMGLDGVLGVTAVPEDRLPPVYLAMILGPSVGGLLSALLVGGPAEVRRLLAGLGAWRVPPGWIVAALLIAPVAITATLLALATTDTAFLPAILATPPGMLLIAVVMGLVVATCEEIGWTGFVLPRLRPGLGRVGAGVVLGLVWGLWHLPLFYGAAATSDLPTALHLSVLLFSFLVPFRVLMVWVFERTRSLAVVVLVHAPLAAGQLVLVPPDLSGAQMVLYDLALAALLWVGVAVMVVPDRRRPARG